MSFEFSVALRYLNAKRKGLFSMLTTVIAIAGVSIGVATLITAMAIITGFETELKDKVLGAQSHIIILGYMTEPALKTAEAKLDKIPEISAYAANLYNHAIITKDGKSNGIMIRGIDPQKESKVTSLTASITEGCFENTADKTPAVVLGYAIAEKMGLSVGNDVIFISQNSVKTTAGAMPKMKKFKLTGVLKTGYYDYDNNVAYTDLKTAGEFFDMKNGANSFAVRLHNLSDLQTVVDKLYLTLGQGFSVRTYEDINGTFYASLRLQKLGMFIILSLIILVAALNIASNLILMGKERLKEIGIMRSIGANQRSISKIFIWEGMMVCTAGIICGILLSLVLCYVVSTFNIVDLPADVYSLSRVPVKIMFTDVVSVIIGSYVLCFVTALYPALRASRIKPIEAIRYGS
ncbi:lipoprotein-releasing system permease protein [Elusimicrobium simillimum]|uniref:FtsX-like permease family protein n=1 Tax=Elusimicrobium simillimum TaxID=3143438 RepID=UPI003C6F38E7